MSSTGFSAELRPDIRLRKRVLLSGAIAAIAGFALILHMPLNALSRLSLVVLWLAWCGIEIGTLTKAWQRVRQICFNTRGEVWISDIVGHRSQVSLQRGSLVTRRFAWLRMRLEDGRNYAELVSGNAVQDCQWHRFQLIWKQSRQIIGSAERS